MNNYRLSLTAASLMVRESQELAALVVAQGFDWEASARLAVSENILGSQQLSTSQRKVSELISRLKVLAPRELTYLANCGTREAAVITWVACSRLYPIVANFAKSFFQRSPLGIWPIVATSMVFNFLYDEEMQFPQLGSISSSTQEKVVQVLRLMARQAGLMDKAGQVVPVCLGSGLDELAGLDAAQFAEYLPLEEGQ